MITQIITRNSTSQEWSTSNPVLLLGEQGYDTTNKKLKIGDGVTKWNELPYQQSDGSVDIVTDLDADNLTDRQVPGALVTKQKIDQLWTQVYKLKDTDNIVDKDNLIVGYDLRSSSGTIYQREGYNVTDIIKINPNTTYYAKGIYTLHLFDDNRVFIKYASVQKDTFTTTENAAYARFSIKDENKGIAMLCASNSILVDYKPFNGRLNGYFANENLENSGIIRRVGTGNLFDKYSIYKDRAFDVSNGDPTYSSIRYISKKIVLVPGEKYITNADGGIYAFDSNGVFIKRGAANIKFIAPINVEYAYITGLTSSIDTHYLDIYSDAGNAFRDFNGEYKFCTELIDLKTVRKMIADNLNSDFFTGKKLTVDGDSITHDLGQYNYWQFILAENFKMDLIGSSFDFDNNSYFIGTKGIAGSRIAIGIENNTKPYCIVSRYDELPSDADVIAIAGGTNDWVHDGVDLGNMDSRDSVNFYGALHNLCIGLINKYPDKLIVFLTPIKRTINLNKTNAFGYKLEDYVNAIINVCGYYGVPVCDLFHTLTMNPSIESQKNLYFKDDTHPNTLGQKKMGEAVAGYFNTLK